MKRILIFIGLKFVELIGLGAVLGIIYLIISAIGHMLDSTNVWIVFVPTFIMGIILAVIVIFGVISLFKVLVLDMIVGWIKSNWQKAGELANRQSK